MRNRYAGPCRECGAHVGEGEGYFERIREGGSSRWRVRWQVRCIRCTAVAKNARGAPLTPPQRAALHTATPSAADLLQGPRDRGRGQTLLSPRQSEAEGAAEHVHAGGVGPAEVLALGGVRCPRRFRRAGGAWASCRRHHLLRARCGCDAGLRAFGRVGEMRIKPCHGCPFRDGCDLRDEFRARAAAFDDVADRLAEVACRLSGELAGLRKRGAWETARVVEIRLRAAIRGEERALDRALDRRLAAARLEHAEGRAKALMGVAA